MIFTYLKKQFFFAFIIWIIIAFLVTSNHPKNTKSKASTKNPKCDKKDLEFFNKMHKKIAMLKVLKLVNHELLVERDQFGQGVGWSIAKDMSNLLKFYDEKNQFIRRELGLGDPMPLTKLETFYKELKKVQKYNY